MRILRVAVTLTATACAVIAGTAPALSAPTADPIPEVGVLTPEAEAALYAELEKSEPVIATYNGREINLANGWQGAQACTEVPSGEVYCYDSTEEADEALPLIDPAGEKLRAAQADAAAKTDAGILAFDDCLYPYVCLFENGNGGDRGLQWSADGTKQLADWDFRDKASSGCVNRLTGGALVYDARTGLPDPYMTLANHFCVNFITAGYPGGGSFNDKADYLSL